MPAEELIVQADSVQKSFGDHEVLRGVDFQVRSGEVACIIGPSGSGKSTFLRTLNGLESVDSGSLRVMGEQVGFSRRGEDYLRWSDKRYAQFRQHIGMVFSVSISTATSTPKRTSCSACATSKACPKQKPQNGR